LIEASLKPGKKAFPMPDKLHISSIN